MNLRPFPVAEDLLKRIFWFFKDTGRFSMVTITDIATSLRQGRRWEVTRIKSLLEWAEKRGLVSRDGQNFNLTLSNDVVSKLLSWQIREREEYVADYNSNVEFLENYLKRSESQTA
jgi:hypothetical protein